MAEQSSSELTKQNPVATTSSSLPVPPSGDRTPVKEPAPQGQVLENVRDGPGVADDQYTYDDEGLYGDDRTPAQKKLATTRGPQTAVLTSATKSQQIVPASNVHNRNASPAPPQENPYSAPPLPHESLDSSDSETEALNGGEARESAQDDSDVRPELLVSPQQVNSSSPNALRVPEDRQRTPAVMQSQPVPVAGEGGADPQRLRFSGRLAQHLRSVPNRRENVPRTAARPTGNAPPVLIPPTRRGPVQAELERLIPEDSSIMTSILAREPRNLFINANRPESKKLEPSELTNYIDEAPAGGTVLIVQDIDTTWADVLLSEFPGSLSPAFFAKHMIRLESASISGKTASDASINLKRLRTSLIQHNPTTGLETSHSSEDWLMVHLSSGLQNDGKGVHVDCDLGSLSERKPDFPYPASDSERWDVFQKYGPKDNDWRSIRTRISWCKLEDHVCKTGTLLIGRPCIADMETLDLILVSGMPDMSKGSNSLWNPSNKNPFQRLLDVRIDSKPQLKAIRSPIIVGQNYILNGTDKAGSTDCVKTTVERLLQQHTPDSVFDPKYVPTLESTDPRPGQCHVFAWLLATSGWQLVVTAMESDLQRLQRNAANKANDEAFSLLRDFRRQVADAEVLIAEYRERLTVAIEGANEWFVNGNATRRIKRVSFWKKKMMRRQSTASVSGRAQSIDIKDLRVKSRVLEGRVNAMANTVNEEIQVVIGSVQVEDAKTMKRQTEVTVVLAVLAAIYLPLTLVTGIFGMNISDISSANIPNRVWVVKV